LSCYHCKEDLVADEIIRIDLKEFCCHGCATVFTILQQNGLTGYYSIPDDMGKLKSNKPISEFNYLDHEDFQDEYVNSLNEEKIFSFYIEGIHCSACLWLLEKLSIFVDGVKRSHLDMSSSVLLIHFSKDVKISTIASQLERIGYPPHPILSGGDAQKLSIKENKQDLMRIGVAFACAGNIMLYSLSVYLGAPKEFANYFNLFSFICSIPIIFYCATPFYLNTLRSLRLKRLSIDVPIVVVLIISFILGLTSFVSEFNFYYFDTISTLVFLLLTSRYLLKMVQKKSLNINQVQVNYANQLAHRLVRGGEETILAKYILAKDKLLVKVGETIPVDGIITNGKSYVNNAILTGESEPVRVEAEQEVFMGALNLDSSIEMIASKTSIGSRMGEILDSVEKRWKQETFFSSLVDKISKYFTFTVLILSLFFFLYFFWNHDLRQAIDNTFSLLLITCPCALAISTPLALLVGLGILLKNNIYVKDEKVLEKILKVNKIFFDKTGTLTTGDFFIEFQENAIEYYSIIYSLELRSTHPIAKSICKKLQKQEIQTLEVLDFQEVRGIGVQGVISGKTYIIKRAGLDGSKNEIGLYCKDECLTLFTVEDHIVPEAVSMIKSLRTSGYDVAILSGDKKQRVIDLGNKFGLDAEHCLYEQTPEQKLEVINKTPNCMMIGDGVNDSAAIQLALVGVAINGSAESSLKAADIYIAGQGVESLLPVILASKKVFSIIKRNLFISLLYNLLGIYLAFNGFVSPVVAAIFMPLSSLSVVFSTLISVKTINKMIKRT
jgi:Cu2+-exporting ATPase/Cu+-exporting ATPase